MIHLDDATAAIGQWTFLRKIHTNYHENTLPSETLAAVREALEGIEQ